GAEGEGGAVPDAQRQDRRRADLSPAADGSRRRADPGAGAAVRDAQRGALRAGGAVSLLRPAGALRARVSGQEAGLRRQEDRQRALALGLRGGGLSVSASQRASAAVEAEAGEEAWASEGAGHSGGAAGTVGLPHAAQRGGV